MEGPLLVLKSWFLTAVALWVYRRWFQRVAPPSPAFEAFCRGEPVVGALLGVSGHEAHAERLLLERLGRKLAAVATLGGFPWPHYRLSFQLEHAAGAVLLRVKGAEVARTRDRDLAALASVLRDVLNELPESAEAWLHRGAFDNGLVTPPEGGWSIARGTQARPKLSARASLPSAVRAVVPLVSSEADVAGYLALENQRPFLLP